METRNNNWPAKIFNLRQDEAPLVIHFLLLNFVQGIGIAFFFTTANALFLAEFKITYLPYVYMAAACLMLIAGRIYAHYEHVMPLKKFLPFITLFLAVSPLLFLFGIFTFNILWLPFLLLVWHQVMYLLNSLRFWGLSSLVFDVRQSKRLFGLISAGDIPAKLLGYLAVSAIVPFLGMESLLVISTCSFLAGFLVLRRILKMAGHKLDRESHHTVSSEDNIPGKLAFLKNFFGDHFIVVLSLLSFIATITFTLIDFSFLSEVKYAFKKDQELAYFFGLFFGLGNAATIVTKIFFSGRIINKIGVKYGLLILPLLVLIVALATNIAGLVSGEHSVYLWLFGIIMLLTEIFKYTLHEPIFLTLFQPLGIHQRLHGHTVVKAIINPVGLGIAGLILTGFIAYFRDVNLAYINGLISLLVIGWIISVFITNKKYVEILKNAIDQRFIKGSELTIKDKSALNHLKQKLKSNSPVAVIHAAELMEKMDEEAFRSEISKLLEYPSKEVRIFALNKVSDLEITAVADQVRNLIEAGEDEQEKAEAIKACSRIDADALNFLLTYLDHKSNTIKKGAIVGLMKSGSLEATVMAGQKLLDLNHSDDSSERMMGATIIGEMGMKNFYQPLLNFLNDKDYKVQEAALKATAQVQNLHLLPEIMNFIRNGEYLVEEATNALGQFDEDAVPAIVNSLPDDQNADLAVKLCTILGTIGGEKATKQLLELLDQGSLKVRTAALYALRKVGYRENSREKRDELLQLVNNHLHAAYWCIEAELSFEQNLLIKTARGSDFNKEQNINVQNGELEQLHHALNLERKLIIERAFILLSFIYDQETVNRAEENLEMEEQENRANAIETLDNLLPKSYSEPLIALVDEQSLSSKASFLSHVYSINDNSANKFIQTILERGSAAFSRWTIATALQACYMSDLECPEALVQNYTDHDSTLIRQVAIKASKAMTNGAGTEEDNKANTITMHKTHEQTEKMLNIEKVLILKSTSIFSGTPENVLVDIAAIAHEVRLNAGEQLIQKGDIGREMYVIHSGEIKIHDDAHVFTKLGEHDILGELALLDPQPRSASATAVTDSLLLRIDQKPFYELMTGRMEVASNVLKVLCRRIREQNQKIVDLKGSEDN